MTGRYYAGDLALEAAPLIHDTYHLQKSTQLLGPRSSVSAKGHVCDRLVTALLYGFSNPPFGVARIRGFLGNLFKFEIENILDNG